MVSEATRLHVPASLRSLTLWTNPNRNSRLPHCTRTFTFAFLTLTRFSCSQYPNIEHSTFLMVLPAGQSWRVTGVMIWNSCEEKHEIKYLEVCEWVCVGVTGRAESPERTVTFSVLLNTTSTCCCWPPHGYVGQTLCKAAASGSWSLVGEATGSKMRRRATRRASREVMHYVTTGRRNVATIPSRLSDAPSNRH